MEILMMEMMTINGGYMIEAYDKYMISKAKEVSFEGNCVRRKVGAVLTQNPFLISKHYKNFENLDFSENIISTGANKCLDGDDSCEKIGCLIVKDHCYRTVHAEINCIKNNGLFGCKGKWLYVTTSPCIKCFQQIILEGITTIKYDDDSYWKINLDHKIYIEKIAKNYNILIEKVMDNKKSE
jgi:dCMP deaminase